MTISKKIIGGYIAILSLLVLVTGVAFYALKQTQATYNNFLNVDERLLEAPMSCETPPLRSRHMSGVFCSIQNYSRRIKFIWPKMTASSSKSSKECAA